MEIAYSWKCVQNNVAHPDLLRPGIDTTTLLLNADTQECLYYEYIRDGRRQIALPREKISSILDVDVRIDLLHCSIDICSVDVPALFTENFDYQDLRVDFVHGVLTSDILGKTIYLHVPKRGYAARVKDTKAYVNITYVIIQWNVGSSPLLTFAPAKTSCHGAPSLWFPTTPPHISIGEGMSM